MMTIWKFPLAIEDGQDVRMPQGAQILSVGLIGDTVFLWAMVDNENVGPKETRKIRIHGTGHHVYKYNLLTFIGTVIQPIEGALPPALVWHVFEERHQA